MSKAFETIIILDFGSQYTQLIARRIREVGVYCEIHPYNVQTETLRAIHPKGIILSGGPSSVYEEGAPHCSVTFSSLEFRFWVSVMVCSCSAIFWEGGLSLHRGVSMERRPSI